MNNNIEEETIHFLRATDFFKDLPQEQLQELSNQCQWVYIKCGDILIHEGEKGDSLFIVISGRLCTTSKVENENVMINEMGRGELIGELALLIQRPRAFTVIAIRDSVLLKLPQESFDRFIKNNPAQISLIFRSAILRLLDSKKKPPSKINSITIAPAGDHSNINEFTKIFINEFKKMGSILYLDRKIIKEKIGIDATDTKLAHWISKQETEYDYIIYQADLECTEWTKRCLRQSDRILLICNLNDNKKLNEIERNLYFDNFSIKKKIDLAILYNKGENPTETYKWLAPRRVSEHHHIRKNLIEDINRLIRIITGQGIALVLGGGGARAMADVGVYKALKELNIPIDLIGGSSFGAIIGSTIAMDCTVEFLIENLKRRIVQNKKIFHRTLPILAMSSGSSLTKAIISFFGEDNKIEDLWKRFFCITCNLSKNKQEIIHSGIIWKSVRASVSLPVIFPPITNEEHDVFIDGGIVNNLPVDVMRQFANGGKVIAVSTSIVKPFKANIPNGSLSGLNLIYQRYIKQGKNNFPTMIQILLKSMGISSVEHEKNMLLLADYAIKIKCEKIDLLDFQAVDKLIEIGYETTMEVFSKEVISDLLSPRK